jgi:hypothetical protein
MGLNMKKTSAFIGTLAVAGSLFAATAMADTSTTSVSTTAPRLIDKLILSYWAAYYGPSITSPSAKTNDSDNNGHLTDVQNLDSTLTMGYKVTDKLNLTANYRFIVHPMLTDDVSGVKDHYTTKDPWMSLVAPKLINRGPFNLWADIRAYVPVQTSGSMNTALRSTQIATIDIPKTRLSLGTYSYVRANSIKEASTLPNMSFDFSPFASYQMTPALAATLWTDIVQIDYTVNQPVINKPVDLSLGVGWDVTSKINLNPQITFFPGYATLEETTLGLIISAKVL